MEIKLILLRGIYKLNEKEKIIFDKLSSEYAIKIQRQLKTVSLIEVLIKDYSKEGKANKFSIHVKVFSSTRTFNAGADDWDFARTLHSAFNKVINEIEHEFHVSDQKNSKKRNF